MGRKVDYHARMAAIKDFVSFNFKNPARVSKRNKARISRAFKILTHEQVNNRLATLSQGTRLFKPKSRQRLKEVARITGYGLVNKDIVAIRVPQRQRYTWRKGKLSEVREDTVHVTVRNFTVEEFRKRAGKGRAPKGKRYAVMVFGEQRRRTFDSIEGVLDDYAELERRYGDRNITGFVVYDYDNQKTLNEYQEHRRKNGQGSRGNVPHKPIKESGKTKTRPIGSKTRNLGGRRPPKRK